MLMLQKETGRTEAGCDEAGRGAMAGPVVAAAVILPADFKDPGLNDSKKLTKKQRNEFAAYIREHALAYAIAFVDNSIIDKINILNASIQAMQNAVRQLSIKPEFLLVDGNRFYAIPDIRHECVIGGDAKYASIAAASILAKTSRDLFMEQLHTEYPMYEWINNKGYGTQTHAIAIMQNGLSPYHRKTFQFKSQLRLQF